MPICRLVSSQVSTKFDVTRITETANEVAADAKLKVEGHECI